jgi:hypothetical protein
VELGKQIDSIRNKYGSFAEGLSYHLIVRFLKETVGICDFIAPGVQVRHDRIEEEYDILAYSNGSLDQGMITCVSGKADLKKQVLENGWHLAHIGDELFELETPENFIAKSYSA